MTLEPVWRRVGIAALQGALLWGLYAALDAGRWPATAPGLYVALVTVIVLVPLLYYLVSGLEAPRSRVWTVLAVASIVLLGIGLHHGTFVTGPFLPRSEGGGQAPTGYALVVAVLCFHALPFAQVFLVNGDWRVRYPDLFRFAWRNALLVALGVLFCGVFWLLLGLWAQLFRMLGISLFVDIFFDARFAIPATTVAAGVGIQLAGSVERLETALREQILALLKWLAPLAALILGLFSVALLVKAPELLAAKQRTISASWLLWLIAMNVLLLNAAYQDGAVQPYPRWLGRAIRWLVPLLLAVASIATYAIAIRIGEYGFTTSRVWAALVALIAIVYAAGYAWASFRRGTWMDGMGRVNVLVALLTMASLILLLTPVLSPFRLAAASQFDRVLASDDSEVLDAYLTLRFDTGAYGRDRLARLAELKEHPRSDEIRRLAAAARAATQRHLARLDVEKVTTPDLLLHAYPEGMDVERALRESIAKAFNEEIGWMRACDEAAGSPCAVLFADLNADGTAEAIVFSANPGGLIFRRIDADWHAAGWLQPGNWVGPEDLHARLQKGDFRVVEHEWSVLMLGDRAFRFRELEPRVSRSQ